jgi:hypothetical protein
MTNRESHREFEIMRMKQDIAGSMNELKRAADFVLEIIYELKADINRLHILECELKES